jgi:hypothetical protein
MISQQQQQQSEGQEQEQLFKGSIMENLLSKPLPTL